METHGFVFVHFPLQKPIGATTQRGGKHWYFPNRKGRLTGIFNSLIYCN